MEFVRAFIVHIIDYYFVLGMPQIATIADANILWSNEFRPRRLKAILMFVVQVFGGRELDFESPQAKPQALALLADYIRRLLSKIGSFENPGDGTACARPSAMRAYDPSNASDSLREYLDQFMDTAGTRHECAIGRFISKTFADEVRDLLNKSPPALQSPREGYNRIIQELRVANESPERISCHSCEKIGDAVIALAMPMRMRLEHTDYSFDYLMEILKKSHYRHPSDSQLNKETSGNQ